MTDNLFVYRFNNPPCSVEFCKMITRDESNMSQFIYRTDKNAATPYNDICIVLSETDVRSLHSSGIAIKFDPNLSSSACMIISMNIPVIEYSEYIIGLLYASDYCKDIIQDRICCIQSKISSDIAEATNSIHTLCGQLDKTIEIQGSNDPVFNGLKYITNGGKI